MNTKSISLISTVVLAVSLPMAQAASSSVVSTGDLKVESTLKQIHNDAGMVGDYADHLHSIAGQNLSRWSNSQALSDLKDEVNDIGKLVNVLNAERDSLSPAEKQALDETLPLAESIAMNTQDAIDYFNQHDIYMDVLTYQRYSNNVFINSEKLEKVLGNSLKDEKLHSEQAQAE